jgi:predicted nucleic acid-binding protein
MPMPKESEGVFIDANVLIYSTFDDFEREKHVQCTESLNKIARSGRALFVSTQVLREFFAIATNGTIFKKPLTPKQATRQMRDFLKLFSLLHEKETTVHLIKDVKKWLLSFGADARLLEPADKREEMKKLAEKVLSQYKG